MRPHPIPFYLFMNDQLEIEPYTKPIKSPIRPKKLNTQCHPLISLAYKRAPSLRLHVYIFKNKEKVTTNMQANKQ